MMIIQSDSPFFFYIIQKKTKFLRMNTRERGKKKMLSISIESNIGSGNRIRKNFFFIKIGKSSLIVELAKRRPNFFKSEQQKVEKWTLLGDYYMDRKKFAFDLQKQIHQSYKEDWEKHFLDQNPIEPEHVRSQGDFHFLDHVKCKNVNFDCGTNTVQGCILFEAILSAYGVFYPVNYQDECLTSAEMNELENNHNPFNIGIRPSIIIWLNPLSIETCAHRIQNRDRQIKKEKIDDSVQEVDKIPKVYLQRIHNQYHDFINKCEHLKDTLILEINNDNLSVSDTADIVEKFIDQIMHV